MSAALGKVFLIGAGPGDPGLITVRGRACLEHAEVVIYDNLANDALLEYAPNAERIFVGKSTGHHTLLQDEINQLLLREAQRVSRVVRLKGGDPFVFGRGGEEALFLTQQGIPFEVVPGVTAGIGVPAYAGIPVTHRGVSGSVTLLTGHEDSHSGALGVDLAQLATQGTLIFYMGVKSLPRVVNELVRLGRTPDTPVAVIEWGTFARQRTIRGRLDSIHDMCLQENVVPPALVVVGAVTQLSDSLSWFENRPLYGKRIAVTRARTQASELVVLLRELGADVFEFPTIEIERVPAPPDLGPVSDYDWIVLTSVNGVDMLFERLDALGRDARDLAGVKLCVIGSATREAVHKRFLRCDLMPENYVAESLLAALETHAGTLAGKRFLLPRADIARSFLPKELRARGAEVTELVAYRTVKPGASETLADALVSYAPDCVTFTSSSTARNFCEIMGEKRLAALLPKTAFASIGPPPPPPPPPDHIQNRARTWTCDSRRSAGARHSRARSGHCGCAWPGRRPLAARAFVVALREVWRVRASRSTIPRGNVNNSAGCSGNLTRMRWRR